MKVPPPAPPVLSQYRHAKSFTSSHRQVPTHNNQNNYNGSKCNVEDYFSNCSVANSRFAKFGKRQRFKASRLPLAATPPRQIQRTSSKYDLVNDIQQQQQQQYPRGYVQQLSNPNHQDGMEVNELMLSLAALLKKRESQIAKSMDTRFEISKSTIVEMMKRYLEKEERMMSKVATEYKTRMDEQDEQKVGWLKKLQLGFEEYQKKTEDLLEALEKNYTESLRDRREFDKEIEKISREQEQEIAQIQEKIHDSSQHIRHTLAAAAKALFFSYYSALYSFRHYFFDSRNLVFF
ncbi:12414_t:CDS:2 [Ambispora gerdemannii]|uniref:12414_t:CDS:1 n=1 Tax=Ambispora gerdemannii TaxID=144530 RepID=A0A9N9AD13_9GLOM|nr:12414_t:CDS:2 [Ambispora gerdemannii]